MKAALWVIGGLCTGSGILMALGKLGGQSGIGLASDGEFLGHASEVFALTGYDATGEVTIFGQGWLALILALTGIAMMVYANAGAWKDTGGY